MNLLKVDIPCKEVHILLPLLSRPVCLLSKMPTEVAEWHLDRGVG